MMEGGKAIKLPGITCFLLSGGHFMVNSKIFLCFNFAASPFKRLFNALTQQRLWIAKAGIWTTALESYGLFHMQAHRDAV
jgi:hypothetical protein